MKKAREHKSAATFANSGTRPESLNVSRVYWEIVPRSPARPNGRAPSRRLAQCPPSAALLGPSTMTCRAYLVSIQLARATFGVVVCADHGVIECAPYGRRMLGRTAQTARAYLRSLPRCAWQIVSSFPCPRGESRHED